MNISEHITFEEAIKSQEAARKGINNLPPDNVIPKMELVANKCFEPMRKYYGKPLIVSSFYRSPELNASIGGSPTSQHCKGEAIDIDTGDRHSNYLLMMWAKENLKFDQLICEYPNAQGYPSWVHISYKAVGNRQQFITIK